MNGRKQRYTVYIYCMYRNIMYFSYNVLYMYERHLNNIYINESSV